MSENLPANILPLNPQLRSMGGKMDEKQRVIDALNKFKEQVALVLQSSPAGLLTASDLKTLTKRGTSAGLSQAEIDLVISFTDQSKKKLMS